MHLKSSPVFAFFLSLTISTANAQLAQGGGLAPSAAAATQVNPVMNVPFLFTVGGVTSATPTLFTQTFAKTALGSWPLGATPLPGVIGLGSIQGEVGKVGQ